MIETDRLLTLVKRRPGLTAWALCKAIYGADAKFHTGSVSSRLYQLAKRGRLTRRADVDVTIHSKEVRTPWRYYR